MLSAITMKQLLEAGSHFGHQTKRWNPKMKKYIFGARNGIYIIDLQKTLNNFNTIKKSIRRLKDLEAMRDSGGFNAITKKEGIMIEKDIKKLDKYLGGIKDMDKLPKAIFVIDTRKERIAINEAKKMDRKSIAVVDTNCDPDGVDFVVPANDDAIRSIRLMSSKVADIIIEAKEAIAIKERASVDEMESALESAIVPTKEAKLNEIPVQI